MVLDAPELPVQPVSPQAGFELAVVAAMVEDRLPGPTAEVIKMSQARSGMAHQGAGQPGGSPGKATQDEPRFIAAGEKRVGDRVDLLRGEALEGERRLEAPVRESPLLLLAGQPLLRQGEGQDTVPYDGDGALLVEGRDAEEDQDAPPAMAPRSRLIRPGCGESLNRNTVIPAR